MAMAALLVLGRLQLIKQATTNMLHKSRGEVSQKVGPHFSELLFPGFMHADCSWPKVVKKIPFYYSVYRHGLKNVKLWRKIVVCRCV